MNDNSHDSEKHVAMNVFSVTQDMVVQQQLLVGFKAFRVPIVGHLIFQITKVDALYSTNVVVYALVFSTSNPKSVGRKVNGSGHLAGEGFLNISYHSSDVGSCCSALLKMVISLGTGSSTGFNKAAVMAEATV